MRKTACALVATAGLIGGAAPAEAHTLTYRAAVAAAQARANAYAGTQTSIVVRVRETRHAYYLQAEWITIDPVGCTGCGLDPVTQAKFDTPGPVIHEIALRSACIGSGAGLPLHRPCSARAHVTRVLA